MVYQFKDGARIPIGITAQAVGESLESIKKEYGALNPENVVKAAEPVGSALHPLFEWDDTEAARKYRLKQAGEVVRAICVKVAPELPPIRAYVSVAPTIEQQMTAGVPLRREYQPIHIVLNNPDSKEQLLSQAKRDLDTYHNRYAALINVSELYLDKLIELGGSSARPVEYFATFKADTEYYGQYVVIRAFHAKGAVETMNKKYGKQLWERIYTEQEFREFEAKWESSQPKLIKLTSLDAVAA